MSLIIPHLDSYQIILSSRGSNVTNRGAGNPPANINSLSYLLLKYLFGIVLFSY